MTNTERFQKILNNPIIKDQKWSKIYEKINIYLCNFAQKTGKIKKVPLLKTIIMLEMYIDIEKIRLAELQPDIVPMDYWEKRQ